MITLVDYLVLGAVLFGALTVGLAFALIGWGCGWRE